MVLKNSTTFLFNYNPEMHKKSRLEFNIQLFQLYVRFMVFKQHKVSSKQQILAE